MSNERQPEETKISAEDEDESLNLELIRKWETNHPKAKGQPVEIKESQKLDK